jgi:hypothetical protein
MAAKRLFGFNGTAGDEPRSSTGLMSLRGFGLSPATALPILAELAIFKLQGVSLLSSSRSGKRRFWACSFEVLMFVDHGRLVDLAVCVAIDDLGARVDQAGKLVNVLQITGFDQRGDDAPVLGATVGASKQHVFRLGVIGWIERSTALLSSSIRPSSITCVRPFQRESA